ncbi:hypothetical protein [Reichenbachiella sp.]|uniref:hypothetical protein n=1 Tax=Reichenbachiella sp. TaxID=2184521 RepID=UPI003BB223AC
MTSIIFAIFLSFMFPDSETDQVVPCNECIIFLGIKSGSERTYKGVKSYIYKYQNQCNVEVGMKFSCKEGDIRRMNFKPLEKRDSYRSRVVQLD